MPAKRFPLLQPLLDHWRHRLAYPDALLLVSLLGLLTGLAAGGVIILFRLLVEGAQEAMLPGTGAENYEALDPLWRMLLPLLAAGLLALMFWRFGQGLHSLGIARVLDRMAHHQGRMTARGFWLQFGGAALAIVGGHSVGREGPHAFLGAAAGSLLGQSLRLPHNVLRTLVGCGTAAGIAASFNTPLAGVIFALEVVMMEYSVASFIPVILAAVSATTLSNLVFGHAPAFDIPAVGIVALDQLGLVVLLGLAAGTLSAAFIVLVRQTATHTAALPFPARLMLAGAVMVPFAGWLPQIMGIGYDTVNAALLAQITPVVLIALVLGKLLATSACIGLGVPGGMIGPAFFIGATLGALVAESANALWPALQAPVGLFALLGMGAMMAGSLQAPLAGLTAMLELTDNPDVILPGMLAVVIAGLTAKQGFGQDSLFLTLLRAAGRPCELGPMARALQRVGVTSVMDRAIVLSEPWLSPTRARQMLAADAAWLVVADGTGERRLLAVADLPELSACTPVASAPQASPATGAAATPTPAPTPGRPAGAAQDSGDARPAALDLRTLPGHRLAELSAQANLLEADALLRAGAPALAIVRDGQVVGVLTPAMTEAACRY